MESPTPMTLNSPLVQRTLLTGLERANMMRSPTERPWALPVVRVIWPVVGEVTAMAEMGIRLDADNERQSIRSL